MNNKIFRGVATALVTPFDEHRTFDEKAFRNFLEFQISNKVNALVPVGSTGEAATLSKEERVKIIKITKEHAVKLPVIAGTGTNSTEQTLVLTKEAEGAGADAALVVCPYYNKPSQNGLIKHFTKIADNSKIPIILYNVPGRTAVNMTPATVLELSKHKNIIGIKEASGDVSQMLEILKNKDEDFAFYSGDDDLALPLTFMGGDGVISVVSNEIPREFSEEISFALGGFYDEAKKIHYKYLDLMNINFCESNPVPVKTALHAMNLMKAFVRLPLTEASKESKEKIIEALQKVGL